MPKNKVVKYEDIVRVEFKDMLLRFLEGRDLYHVYSVGRLCSYATMVGMDYGFSVCDSDCIIQFVNLKGFGKLEFKINVHHNSAEIVTENHSQLIYAFLEDFETNSEAVSLE